MTNACPVGGLWMFFKGRGRNYRAFFVGFGRAYHTQSTRLHCFSSKSVITHSVRDTKSVIIAIRNVVPQKSGARKIDLNELIRLCLINEFYFI